MDELKVLERWEQHGTYQMRQINQLIKDGKKKKNYRIDLPEDYFNEVDSKLKN